MNPWSPSFSSTTPPLITVDVLEVGEQGVRTNGVHYVPVMAALSQVPRCAELRVAASLVPYPLRAATIAAGRPFGHGRMDGHEMKRGAQVEDAQVGTSRKRASSARVVSDV